LNVRGRVQRQSFGNERTSVNLEKDKSSSGVMLKLDFSDDSEKDENKTKIIENEEVENKKLMFDKDQRRYYINRLSYFTHIHIVIN
jgi:hypothetical protein